MAAANRLSRAKWLLHQAQAGFSNSSRAAVPEAWGQEGSWIARQLHSSPGAPRKLAGAPIPLTTGR